MFVYRPVNKLQSAHPLVPLTGLTLKSTIEFGSPQCSWRHPYRINGSEPLISLGDTRSDRTTALCPGPYNRIPLCFLCVFLFQLIILFLLDLNGDWVSRNNVQLGILIWTLAGVQQICFKKVNAICFAIWWRKWIYAIYFSPASAHNTAVCQVSVCLCNNRAPQRTPHLLFQAFIRRSSGVWAL